MSTIFLLWSIENKHDVHRGKDCMKTFCEFIREHAMKKLYFKKKKNEVVNKIVARVYAHRGAAHSICNLKY